MKPPRLLKRLAKAVLGRAVWISPRVAVETERHGSEYGGWNIVKGSLGPGSVVLSFGLGEDITFDTSLIERYGCRVHGFDPTPRAIAHARAVAPEGFTLHEIGLSDRDGTLELFMPENPDYVSVSEIRVAGHTSTRSFPAPVRRLSTILSDLGLERVDVLKMDIEGSEYAIVENPADRAALGCADQLLIEFHHMWRGISAGRTGRAIRLLEEAGFRLAWISESDNEFLFVREDRGPQLAGKGHR